MSDHLSINPFWSFLICEILTYHSQNLQSILSNCIMGQWIQEKAGDKWSRLQANVKAHLWKRVTSVVTSVLRVDDVYKSCTTSANNSILLKNNNGTKQWCRSHSHSCTPAFPQQWMSAWDYGILYMCCEKLSKVLLLSYVYTQICFILNGSGISAHNIF